MTQPFEDIRENVAIDAYVFDEAEIHIPFAQHDIARLLSAVDALMEVVGLLEIAEEDPGTVYFSATAVYDAIDTLPPELKEALE